MNNAVVGRVCRATIAGAFAAVVVSCSTDEVAPRLLVPTASRASDAASNERLHVYVHYDYLVFSGPSAHSDAPDPAAIQLVVDAFSAHGIDLVIDSKHAEIPGKQVMFFSLSGDVNLCENGQYDPLTLQAQYFRPTSNHEWHYAVFGDYVDNGNCRPDVSTGVAELNGDNFVVAVQGLLNNPRFVAGTFMHELGHNLGLDHGGNEARNYKPNYLSVMNYSFQLGIPYAASIGSTSTVGWRLDYSATALPTLDELHLDETRGIQAGSTDITFFNTPLGFGIGPAGGAIDWNQDGQATGTDVAVDVDLDRCGCVDPTFDKLTGFDDWTAVRGNVAGTLVHGPKTIVHENRASQPVVDGISPASGPASGGTVVTITGTHFDKVTRVGFGAAGPATFTIVDTKTIVATAPPAPLGGYVTDITVMSGTDASPLIATDRFTYTNVLPVVSSVSPTSGPGGTVITVRGSNFIGTHDVAFAASTAEAFPSLGFTVIDDHTITVQGPGYLLGAYHVLVYNAYGTNLASFGPNDIFRFTPPPPAVLLVNPAFGPEAGGTTVSLLGSGFFAATAVKFGEVNAASFTVVDDNSITARSPAGAGAVDVTVTTANGTSAPRAEDRFTYLPPAPTVTSVSPASGPGVGGTAITIHGTGFTAATVVSIGQYGIASFTIVNDSTIVAVTNPAVSAVGSVLGAFHVTVTNAGGTSTSTSADLFTYF